MGWVDQLRGATVALDAAPLIYFAEEHPRYPPLVEPCFIALDHGQFQVIASVIALLEVLVAPIRNNDIQLAEQYRDILQRTQGVTTVVVTAEIAEGAARLRARSRVKTPDAIHLATAL